MTVRRSVGPAAMWDEFSQRCGASFRCSYRGIKSWQIRYWLFNQLRLLDVMMKVGDQERKIGQCAVGVGRRERVFCDGVQLLPEFAEYWGQAIEAILEHLGQGSYTYGSDWSIEPPRDGQLREIAGVVVKQVQPTWVQTIDFTAWDSWEDYQKSVSTNVRRNVSKAGRAYRRLEIKKGGGPTTWGSFVRSMGMRRALFRRKGVSRLVSVMAIRSVVRLFTVNQYSGIAYFIGDGKLRSFYSGIVYGSHFYYLEGASTADNQGASWYLLMNRIEEAYRASGGRGKFIMGSDDGTQVGTESWEGLRRSRKQCCVTALPTSVVRFEYDGTRAIVKRGIYKTDFAVGGSYREDHDERVVPSVRKTRADRVKCRTSAAATREE